MALDGYRIFDSDTHVGPDAGILSTYLSAAEREGLAGWVEYESRDRHGKLTYTKGQRRYRRRLGDAEPDWRLIDHAVGQASGPSAGNRPARRC